MEDNKELTGLEKRKANLVSFEDMTPSEQRRIASMGGVQSGKNRKNKKLLKEMFESMSESSIPPMIKEKLESFGIKTEGLSFIEAIVKIASLKTAEKRASLSDIIKFMEIYAKYTGQEPPKEIVVSGGLEANFDKIKEMESKFDDK